MPAKLTQEVAIGRMKASMPEYDYSKFVYGGSTVAGVIICPTHGEVTSTYDHIKGGHGCMACRNDKLPTHRFLGQVRAVAEMQFVRPEYEYSKFVYTGSATKSTVICPIHGEFPGSHQGIKAGHGCPKCSVERRTAAATRPTEDAVAKMMAKCPEYSYDRFIHTGNRNKGLVTCSSHGDFPATFSSIMRGRGCPKCGIESRTAIRTLDVGLAMQRMKDAQPQYDYSKFIFKNSGSKGVVICPVHGEFPSSYNFIVNGTGCKKCHFEAVSIASRTPFLSFVERARAVHGETYTYDEETYTSISDNVVAVCKDHGRFLISCNEHIYGQGCPDCKDSGFNPKKRAFLYIYRLVKDDVPYLGYGITGSVTRRNAEHQKMLLTSGATGDLLHTFRFRRGYLCRMAESCILSVFDTVNVGVRGFQREATHWHNYERVLSVATDLQSRFGSISDIDEAMRIAA